MVHYLGHCVAQCGIQYYNAVHVRHEAIQGEFELHRKHHYCYKQLNIWWHIYHVTKIIYNFYNWTIYIENFSCDLKWPSIIALHYRIGFHISNLMFSNFWSNKEPFLYWQLILAVTGNPTHNIDLINIYIYTASFFSALVWVCIMTMNFVSW